MKPNHKLSLTIITSLAIILPMSAFAEDQNQDEKKHEKKNKGTDHLKGKVTQQGASVSTVAPRTQGKHVHNEGKVNNASGGQGHVSHILNESAKVPQSNIEAVTSQTVASSNRAGRNQLNQSQTISGLHQNQTRPYSNNQSQYTKSNNYGGLWFVENTHRDWNRNGEHYWNHHQYRWYEGGWLIIDGGYSPYYSDAGYSNGGSTASSVQMRLADQGYYRGPIDGDIGPGTRNAIADYQSDHDLRV